MRKWIIISGLMLGSGFIFTSGVFYGKKKMISKIQYCGQLRIDQSAADEAPKLFCELEIPIEVLNDVTVAMFKVVNKNHILRK